MADNKQFDVKLLVSGFGSHIFNVVFIKKDGSVRRMNVQQAAASNHLRNNPDPLIVKMLEKRQKDNPHLLNLWSIDDSGFRAVDINRIISIRHNGKTFVINQVDVK